MTATIATGLSTATGPRLGVVHLLQLRHHPIEHNDFLRETYGDVLKLNVFGTTLYATAGLDAAEQVLINRDRIFANGPAWSHFIGPFFRRGLMLLDFDEHLHHRRILQHAFTNDALRRYHAVMVPHIRSGLAAWQTVEKPRMHQLFKELTLDIALETFVGVDLTPRRAGPAQPGVHRRRPGRHVDLRGAGARHAVGQGPGRAQGARGVLLHPPAREAPRPVATTCSPSCASRRARTVTSSATRTSSTT